MREPVAGAGHVPKILRTDRRRLGWMLVLAAGALAGGGWLGSKLAVPGCARCIRPWRLGERYLREQGIPCRHGVQTAAALALSRAEQDPKALLTQARGDPATVCPGRVDFRRLGGIGDRREVDRPVAAPAPRRITSRIAARAWPARGASVLPERTGAVRPAPRAYSRPPIQAALGPMPSPRGERRGHSLILWRPHCKTAIDELSREAPAAPSYRALAASRLDRRVSSAWRFARPCSYGHIRAKAARSVEVAATGCAQREAARPRPRMSRSKSRSARSISNCAGVISPAAR